MALALVYLGILVRGLISISTNTHKNILRLVEVCFSYIAIVGVLTSALRCVTNNFLLLTLGFLLRASVRYLSIYYTIAAILTP